MARLPSSAGYRIAILYSSAFAVAILLLGVTVYFAADAEFRGQREAALSEELSELAMIPNRADLLHEIARRETSGPISPFGYAVFDARGQRIGGALVTPMPAPGTRSIVFKDPREGDDDAIARTAVLRNGDRLVVAVDSEAIEQIDATILELFGSAFIVVVAIGVIGALLLGGYLRERLASISGTAQSIVAGDLTRRVVISRAGDEFDQAGLALNAMLDRIGALMENLRQVSSDVAHDLRAPLIRLRNQLERIGAGEEAERAIELGDDLLKLFAAILRIAEVEAGALVQGYETIDLSLLATEIGDDFRPAIVDSGRTLHCSIEPDLHLLGDRELLAQAMANLLDNARIHTPTDTNILLSLHAEAQWIMLGVADNGPGVAPEDRTRILQRFFRTERSRTTPGHGLGLSLVAAVAWAHRGSVTVDTPGRGLHVTMTVPRLAA